MTARNPYYLQAAKAHDSNAVIGQGYEFAGGNNIYKGQYIEFTKNGNGSVSGSVILPSTLTTATDFVKLCGVFALPTVQTGDFRLEFAYHARAPGDSDADADPLNPSKTKFLNYTVDTLAAKRRYKFDTALSETPEEILPDAHMFWRLRRNKDHASDTMDESLIIYDLWLEMEM